MTKNFPHKTGKKRARRAIGTGSKRRLKPSQNSVNFKKLKDSKEKLKKLYGLDERILQHYVKTVIERSEKPAQELLRELERRFDNVIYRSGFAPNRLLAKKLIRAGSFKINGDVIDDPNYHLEQHKIIVPMNDNYQIYNNTTSIRPWIKIKKGQAFLSHLPKIHDLEKELKELQRQLDINIIEVIEFYSIV